MDYRECPQCGGTLFWLGQLGRLTHWRCRHCGAMFSTQEEGDE